MESAGPLPNEPRSAEDLTRTAQVRHPQCPFCHSDVRPGQLQPFGCSTCMAWSHHACWEEHGSCPACGHKPGPRPGGRGQRRRSQSRSGVHTHPQRLQSQARDGTAEPTPQSQPWWVGRTNHCTRCSNEFVVTNRYQRYTCPACVRGSTFLAVVLLLICGLLYAAFTLGPELLG